MRDLFGRYTTVFAFLGCSVLVLLSAVTANFAHSRSVTSRMAPSGDTLGYVRVIDGDTLEISGKRIRLEGIDAPETAQKCPRRWFGNWACGKQATRWLEQFIARRAVRCVNQGVGKYGRMIGICFVGTKEINKAMVREGYAWAFVKYSKRYKAEEDLARRNQRGIWTGSERNRFAVPAWEYRRKRWTKASDVAPNGCAIKGNISRNGRIYHAPWSPWYDRVQVSKSRGERWFCSERDAVAAGWRPAAAR